MKLFAALYRELDATTSSLAKQAALQRYLQSANPADAAWAVYFLAGGKPRQLVPAKLLRRLAQEAAGLPEWLFDESYEAVGDLAETISLLLPAPDQTHDMGLGDWIERHLLPLRRTPPEQLADTLHAQWRRLALDERLVYFKLITGGFRVGVSRLLPVHQEVWVRRLLGPWQKGGLLLLSIIFAARTGLSMWSGK